MRRVSKDDVSNIVVRFCGFGMMHLFRIPMNRMASENLYRTGMGQTALVQQLDAYAGRCGAGLCRSGQRDQFHEDGEEQGQ